MVALSTAFCPPIEYFAILAGYSSVYLDSSELYNKQSWRNRCRILSGNGPLDINVPVVHGDSRLITEVRVEYTTPWEVKAERAVASAYDSSPFFEFYRDGLFAILDSHPDTLWDLNWQIIVWLCGRIGIAAPGAAADSPERVRPLGEELLDLREAIHPKRPNTVLRDLGLGKPYWQVFGDRFGFTPGLSVLDLLFNEGPDSILWLK